MLPQTLNQAPVQLIILFGTLALYLLTNAIFGGEDNPNNFIPLIVGILVLIEMFLFIGMEVKAGSEKHGWKHEVLDTIIALGVAIAIWIGASILLNTSSPVSGVVSCSMLPELQRGDFILVRGTSVDTYELNMTEAELKSLTGRATVSYGNEEISFPGSIFSYCVNEKKEGLTSDLCRQFIENPEKIRETKGVFSYNYESCPLDYSDGGTVQQPCLKSVTYKGTEYFTNMSNDIIVYQPLKGDYYSYVGDIVHRAYFKIDVDGEIYYLTRGDNNPLLDIQVYEHNLNLYNRPVPEENVRGKVIFRVPLLGYFKLFIHGYFKEDAQCRTQLNITSVS